MSPTRSISPARKEQHIVRNCDTVPGTITESAFPARIVNDKRTLSFVRGQRSRLRFFQPHCVTSPNALLNNFRVADNTEVSCRESCHLSGTWALDIRRPKLRGNAAFVASCPGQKGYLGGRNRVIGSYHRKPPEILSSLTETVSLQASPSKDTSNRPSQVSMKMHKEFFPC